MNFPLIYHQHLYLRLAIFLLGIATGFEASLRQLITQILLVLVYLTVESQLYGKLAFALRKLLTFLAGYWLFALLFKVEFPQAVNFSLTIIYLILITVAAWGSLDKRMLLAQCACCRKYRAGRAALSFSMATYFFIRKYIAEYQSLGKQESIAGILDRAIVAGQKVHESFGAIEEKVQALQIADYPRSARQPAANLYGLMFLSLMVLLSNI
ncbi:MAG: hypothetical protein RBR69_05520 [Candidatus Cloacimonadaceae bacterium]|jgi:hypothetical protein|nr:hypothetical protein [Candidatus Cloacimonadota bacterium]MDY0127570.1 hypothetical protein [Candidatus Cloacimonadaceae bacterium]MCB5255444.1 hypothetical protein [Candidatus Cloacimonadota bacterium]MCK9177899.1 hypothetical protein [Candidatus Cloacimonadota bacterium]MCK9242038.1 hypothetical protein [Candidatus Cloacimonadota bacterium]